jgi:hypothetical protein
VGCSQDFTDRATVVADLRTAYRVGKGMLGAIEELTPAPADPPAAAIDPAATPSRLKPPPDEVADSAPATSTVARAESA